MMHRAIPLVITYLAFYFDGIYCQSDIYQLEQVEVGENATLHCLYTKDKNVIHWFKGPVVIGTIINGTWSNYLGPNYAPGPDSSLVVVHLQDDHNQNYSCRSNGHIEFFIVTFKVTAKIISINLFGKETNVIFKVEPEQLRGRLLEVVVKATHDDQPCNKDYMSDNKGQKTPYEQLERMCDSTFSIKCNVTVESDKPYTQLCAQFKFKSSVDEQYLKFGQIKNKTEPTPCGKKNSGYQLNSTTGIITTGSTPRGKSSGFQLSPTTMLLTLVLLLI